MSAKNQPITINGITVNPGEQQVIDLPVAKLYTHANVSIPLQVICSKKPGPRLFISAAIHGDELNGVEIVRRLVKTSALKRLSGTLIVIPIVNVFGIIQHSRYLPDRRDLNRSFPGSKRGSLAARLAHIFLHEVVRQCDFGIDLHTGAIHRSNLPQIRANLDDPETKELSEAFSVPVLLNSNLRDGSLRQVADEHGVKVLLYEAGEALRFDELSIRAGVRGILSVMRSLKMLPQTKAQKKRSEPFIARSSNWERAPESGILRSIAPLGARVNKGDLLGVIADPSDLFDPTEYEVKAQCSGLVIGKSNIPLVNEGDALFHIARFEDIKEAAASVEAFQNTAENTPNPVFDDQTLI
ncbi:succinylglutamate desuccinylase/aspartoacylase family protein [Teredinibacter franksiae]|uniref:succinylglutamate desuccinylase/aspartoacylase family protein n=1 Tax=Teredinibacter franksiae TaxID=2761453 RepID=UPI0016265AA5|nr:succinylglutamate desuccinylase/aspartoacylase family protein [Teredinibacter franksiae]